MKLYLGDCLEIMKEIIQPVDMILADLPYGTTECSWDKIIPFDLLWKNYWRVLVPDGAVVLFGNFPFSARAVLSQIQHFRYSLVWKRSRVTRHAQSKNRPLSEHEDLLVFSKGKCSDNSKIKMKYFPQGTIEINPKMSTYKAHSLRPGRKDKIKIQTRTNFPRSILEFASDARPVHPTQKPVGLLEYLILTYTRPDEVVLDNTMGSGSTGVACKNTGRKFIGIERDEKYFKIAQERLSLEEEV